MNPRALRITHTALVLAALLLAAPPCSPIAASAAETATDTAAILTVQTTDGLIILHGARPDIDKAQLDAAAAFPNGATNAQLHAYLLTHPLAPQLAVEQYLSYAGSAAASDSIATETTIRQAARAGLIPAIEGKQLHEAYMLVQMRGDTFMLIGDPPENAPQTARTLFIFSSTWGTGLDGIFIDGRDRSPQATGYNLVALSPGGKEIARAGFETFSDADSGTKMQQFIDSLPPGSILLASVKVGPGVYLSGGAVQSLRNFGSTAEPDTQILSSDALIGAKNLKPGAAIEQSHVNGAAAAILFNGALYLKPTALPNLQPPPPGSRIIAIAGTNPDDKLFIFGPK